MISVTDKGYHVLHIDKGQITIESLDGKRVVSIGSPEGFELLSQLWLRSGWDTKYVYSFTWLGRPIIQLPEDMIRIQEVIYRVKPDVIIETGVAHGGGLVFYASLCKLIGRGRVIGVEIGLRPHNRRAIEDHPLCPLITIIEGNSIDPEVVRRVRECIAPDETVMVVLDAKHTKEHVLAELHAYAPLISKGSYIVAMDGIMEQLVGAPRTQPDWSWNNPRQAAWEFIRNNPNFAIREPELLFNEGFITKRVTYWPEGFIERLA